MSIKNSGFQRQLDENAYLVASEYAYGIDNSNIFLCIYSIYDI